MGARIRQQEGGGLRGLPREGQGQERPGDQDHDRRQRADCLHGLHLHRPVQGRRRESLRTQQGHPRHHPGHPAPGRRAPTAPSKLTGSPEGSRAATLAWGASKDDVGVTSYDIYQEGSRIHSVPASETTAKLTGLRPGTVYTFTVRARDASDKSSADSKALDLTTDSAPGAPASTAPTGLRTEIGKEGEQFTVDLSWDQPDTGGTIPAYQLYLNGKPTTTIVWGGTPPKGRATYRLNLADPAGTRYSVKLRAKLPDGKWGDFSAQPTIVLAENG